jgi:hypothetical protein
MRILGQHMLSLWGEGSLRLTVVGATATCAVDLHAQTRYNPNGPQDDGSAEAPFCQRYKEAVC